MVATSNAVLRFGVYEVEVRSGELRRGGVLVKLQPQPLKVLRLLAERAGEVVLREELVEAVWGRENVNVDYEIGLNHCIKQIRAALEDDAEHPRYIETLPKRGYRFLAPVERLAAPASHASAAPSPPRVTDRKPGGEEDRSAWSVDPVSLTKLAAVVLVAVGLLYGSYWLMEWLWPKEKLMLVVVPFDNLSGDPGQDYFSAGLTEEMATQLGRLKPERLGVFARTTSEKMKGKSLAEVRRELRADYAIEGSVRLEGERRAISVNLIQLNDLTHLWAETYEVPVGDVLAVQREVARRVADSLRLVLLPEEREELARATRPVDPQAFDAYLKGRHYWAQRNPASLLRSVAHFEKALERDPNFALAWAALGDTYALLGSTPYDMLPAHEAVPQAKEAARQALRLDPGRAEAHNALAHALLFYDWDWEGAEREFQHAIEQNPGYATARQWYAEYLWVTGRTEEALGQLQEALGSDPLSIVVQLAIGRHYYLTRQYEQALAHYRDAIGDEPGLFLGHLHLGLALVQTGQHQEALAALKRAVELFPGSPLCLAALGHAQARAGQEEQARAVAAQLEQMASQRPVQALYIAGVYAGLGDNERAFGWLERAYQERSTYVIFLGIEPIFDPVRDDPRFGQLIGRIGLPAPD